MSTLSAADVASLHEQERYEYVPSARATLDAEQLMLQHSAGLQGAASSYTLEQRQQVVEAEHSQVCAEPDSTASLYEDSPQCSNPAETVCAAGAPTLASAESHAEEPPPAAAGSAVACKYGSQGMRQKMLLSASNAFWQPVSTVLRVSAVFLQYRPALVADWNKVHTYRAERNCMCIGQASKCASFHVRFVLVVSMVTHAAC